MEKTKEQLAGIAKALSGLSKQLDRISKQVGIPGPGQGAQG